MKVIFLEDIAGTADAGDVKDVKNGFARNYLVPQGLAAPATPHHLQRVAAIEKAAHKKRLKYSLEWTEVAEAMEGLAVEVEVRVGPSGRLFGSVTARLVAEKITESIGREIDHRQILLGAAIHEPGDYPIAVRLYRDVIANVIVSVVPEGYTPDEEAALAVLTEEALAAADGVAVDAEAADGAEGSGEEESAKNEEE